MVAMRAHSITAVCAAAPTIIQGILYDHEAVEGGDDGSTGAVLPSDDRKQATDHAAHAALLAAVH